MKEINRVKQPEVGDVWEYNDNSKVKILIVKIECETRLREIKTLGVTEIVPNQEQYEILELYPDGNVQSNLLYSITDYSHTYIGKAKNPITSIFEVE